MKLLHLLILAVILSTSVQAQKQITVEDFTTKNTFTQRTVSGINWMKGGKFYSSLTDNKIVKYDITSGLPVQTLFSGDEQTLKISIQNYSFSADESRILLLTAQENIYRRSYTAEYYVYDLSSKKISRLSATGRQSYATFSPDGSRVAFVRNNNLFYTDLATMSETQVTEDGKFNSIINGTTDWVYEEEFSFVIGFYWSPDGKKIAYYRFDESAVREYTMQVWTKRLYPADYRFKYPKAGEANSTIEIWTYDLASRKKVKADIGTETDIYIPRVMWTADPNTLSIRKLNRLQNSLEIIHSDASTGVSKIIVKEESKTYIDLEFTDDLTYLNDGKHFIHASETSGYKHLYLYGVDGKLIRPLTSGNFEVTLFSGVDEKAKTVYYISPDPSPLQRHLFAVSLDGKKRTRLSQASGTHTINMSSDHQFYIDYHHSSTQPLTVNLYRTKGNVLVKTLEKNEQLAKTSAEYGIAKKEFFSFKSVDGTELNGMMMKPAGFDPAKQYPVLIYQYSGPGSQNVSDSWGGGHYYFHQLLIQKGYIIAVIDTRGTGARGEQFKKMTYGQLGKYELEDHIAGAKFLASLNYIDDNRIGIWGWSYGGYVTSLAMTKGGGIFKTGIAVAPVTNWRFYDTVYTERFLKTPQLNPGGYDDNSPLTFASGLQGNFLLIHGTGDDNVHFQNSVLFEDALINAGKQFRSFYYPDKHHGIQGAATRLHLYTMLTDYILENL